MTKNKDLKKKVRARMKKTGESYTSARAAMVAKSPPKADWPALAGMKDESVAAKTGKTWAQWVAALDAAGARSKTHRDIAAHVRATYPGVSGWWAQTVTVGYERIRGLREKGQQRTTRLYDANKSRTFPVGVAALYRAFASGRERAKWLDAELAITSSKKERSIRATAGEGTKVHLSFVDKGPEKSAVSVQHRGLPTKKAADATKAAWHARLDALGARLKR